MKKLLFILISSPILLHANPAWDHLKDSEKKDINTNAHALHTNPIWKHLKDVQRKAIGTNAYQAKIPGGAKKFTPFFAQLTSLVTQHPHHAATLTNQLKNSKNPHDASRLELLQAIKR